MPAKIIFDAKSEIPEHLRADAKETEEGKFELAAEGVLKKNKELLGTNKTLSETKETLESQIETLKTQIPGDGKTVVDKKEYDAAIYERDAYKALGELKEIQPKVEGFDSLKLQAKQAVKDKALFNAGVTDLDRARQFKSYDALEFESEIKDGKEIFYHVAKDDKGKETKTVFTPDSLKTDTFKDNLGSLLGEPGKPFIRQASSGTTANIYQRIREEKEAESEQKAPTTELATRFGVPAA